jgi:hypothetical protein
MRGRNASVNAGEVSIRTVVIWCAFWHAASRLRSTSTAADSTPTGPLTRGPATGTGPATSPTRSTEADPTVGAQPDGAGHANVPRCDVLETWQGDTAAVTVRIDRADFDDPGLESFLQAHLDDIAPTAPCKSQHALDLEALQRPTVRLWVVREDSDIVGTGALAALEPGHEELKSMRGDVSAHLVC